MSTLQEELSDISNTKPLRCIQFGLMNPRELKRFSVLEVKRPETFDGKRYVSNGLFDTRMGVIDRGIRCETCKNNSVICPGHFGHIELAMPVYYVEKIDYVIKILSCICFKCSSLLILKSKIKNIIGKRDENRFKAIYDMIIKNKKVRCCPVCNFIQPEKYRLLRADKATKLDTKSLGFNKSSMISIAVIVGKEQLPDKNTSPVIILTPQACHDKLEKITDNDCRILGFNPMTSRPEWMICSVLPVPPPSVRPSVQRDNTQRSEDDLTYQLSMVIKSNNILKKKMLEYKDDPVKLSVYQDMLQWNVGTLISNKSQKLPRSGQRSSGKPTKSLVERIGTKAGRIRNNLSGKRLNKCARSVISVATGISIDEIGVPIKIATKMSQSVLVNEHNYNELLQYVRNGPTQYPGALSITRKEHNSSGKAIQTTLNLKHVSLQQIQLKLGDVVNRHLIDGDLIFMNRQPSLHRPSMQMHKVRVMMQGDTFRLNVFVCPPYNADFDGDEMNGYLSGNQQPLIEAKLLAGVSNNIISPSTSTAIIIVQQDSTVGSYLLTRSDFASSGADVYQYVMGTTFLKKDLDVSRLREKKSWSGKDIYSLLMPNISLRNIKYEEEKYEKGVDVKNGTLVEGLMSKYTLGGSSKGIIQAIVNQYGNDTAKNFLDNLQSTVIRWMENYGFTIGFGDTLPSVGTTRDIEEVIVQKFKETNELIAKAHMGLYEPNLKNELKKSKLEIEIGNIASELTSTISKIVSKNLEPNNNFMISVTSGSKGKAMNLKQIRGAVGQQMIDGKRLPNGYTGRVLPHFAKYNTSLDSRGFVKNCYAHGITAPEFFFCSMKSRSDAISGNIKTADTGYIQRKLIKSMEDLTVQYDLTVRDAYNNIVLFSYGTDGYDSIKLEHVPLKLIEKSDREMKDMYFISADDSRWKSVLTEKAYQRFIKENNEDVLQEEFKTLMQDRHNLRYKYFPDQAGAGTVLAPIHPARLIHHMLNQYQIKSFSQTDLTPVQLRDMLQEIIDEASAYHINDNFSPIIKILIRSLLSCKQCIFRYRLSASIMREIITTIRLKMINAIINPGEFVGIVAAQSIGEPITQLVLNTQHRDGLGKNAVVTTSGVPRINEILNISEKIKTPSMTIYLKDQYCESKEMAFNLKKYIEFTKVKDLVLKTELVYLQPDNRKQEDKYQDELFERINRITKVACLEPDTLSRWTLSIEFDREIMLRKGIYIKDIYKKINQNTDVQNNIHCVVSDANAQTLGLRIKINERKQDNKEIFSFFRKIANEVMEIRLKGVAGIKKVGITSNKKVKYLADGTQTMVDEWILNTDGSNMVDILPIPFVDVRRTTTNNIREIHNLFGIEGARKAIIREINNTVSEGAGKHINQRHYDVLASLMTYRGELMSICKNGFGKSPFISSLNRATFETMDKILISAGIFGDKINMKGTSSNVIFGQCPKGGTNSFELYFNPALLPPPPKEYKDANDDKNKNDFKSVIMNSELDMTQSFKNDMKEKESISIQEFLALIEGYLPENAETKSIYAVKDEDFSFGYSVIQMKQHRLPEYPDVDVVITEKKINSTRNTRNTRRR